jgi:nucleoside-diphosphate-sugar epimerase
MKILVTGGIGNIGFVVVKYLLDRGYELRVIDHKSPEEFDPGLLSEIQNAEYRQVDIRNFEAVKDSLEGMHSVVHLAAIPHPMINHASEIFEINAGGTFNIYQAAADFGIKRIVSASSINFLGNGFGKRMIDVKYFPIDEEHPGYATDVYAFSKQLVEAIATYFWQRDGVTSACLRFPFVYNPARFSPDMRDQYRQSNQVAFNYLMELSKGERREIGQNLIDLYLTLRNQRMNGMISFSEMMQTTNSIPGGALMFGFSDFWTHLHVQDAALSIERALVADYEGCQPFYIADPENSLGLPSRDLVELFYPDVKIWKRDIQNSQTLLNCEKAKLILGFEVSKAHLSGSI